MIFHMIHAQKAIMRSARDLMGGRLLHLRADPRKQPHECPQGPAINAEDSAYPEIGYPVIDSQFLIRPLVGIPARDFAIVMEGCDFPHSAIAAPALVRARGALSGTLARARKQRPFRRYAVRCKVHCNK